MPPAYDDRPDLGLPADRRIGAEDLRRVFELNEFPVVRQKTASFGVATYRPDDQAKDIVARADAALYRAKHGGRNRVMMADQFEQPAHSAADRRGALHD